MAETEPQYQYRVARDARRPGFVDVALLRGPAHQRFSFLHRRDENDTVVMFHRLFRITLELSALETYAAKLARVAQHGNDGTLGCFVETSTDKGSVVITLYERWFDGAQLHCEELTRRVFDPSDENALVASAEFIAELEEWAERRNEERNASYLDASADDAARVLRSIEQESAAAELAGILSRRNRNT
jgi:hypothetical protein